MSTLSPCINCVQSDRFHTVILRIRCLRLVAVVIIACLRNRAAYPGTDPVENLLIVLALSRQAPFGSAHFAFYAGPPTECTAACGSFASPRNLDGGVGCFHRCCRDPSAISCKMYPKKGPWRAEICASTGYLHYGAIID